jgi:hypothetical protein
VLIGLAQAADPPSRERYRRPRADRDALDPGDRFGARERNDRAAVVTTSRSGTRQSVMRSQIIFCDGGASCSRKQATNFTGSLGDPLSKRAMATPSGLVKCRSRKNGSGRFSLDLHHKLALDYVADNRPAVHMSADPLTGPQDDLAHLNTRHDERVAEYDAELRAAAITHVAALENPIRPSSMGPDRYDDQIASASPYFVYRWQGDDANAIDNGICATV